MAAFDFHRPSAARNWISRLSSAIYRKEIHISTVGYRENVVEFSQLSSNGSLSAGKQAFPQVFHNHCGRKNADFIRLFGRFFTYPQALLLLLDISYLSFSLGKERREWKRKI